MHHRSAPDPRTAPAPGSGPAPFPGAPDAARADVVVEARDVVRVYGSGEARVVALGGVSLSVERGQFVAVMGPSGSGKSTLLHCLAGLDSPTSGSVLIAGQDLAGMNDRQLTRVRRDRLGFVFQAFNLLPTLSAEENILLPLRLARRRPDEQWYRAVIDALGIADRLDHRPSQLSGGQQQRVAVARALAGRPEVVFADEPTGALDTASAASLLYHGERSCNLISTTNAACGNNFARDGGLGLLLVIRSERTAQPVQDVLNGTGDAVVVLRGKEPYAISSHDSIPNFLNTFKSWEFFVLVEKRDVQNVNYFNLCLAFKRLCSNLTQHPIERVLTTRTDDKYNFLHEKTSP